MSDKDESEKKVAGSPRITAGGDVSFGYISG